MPTQIELLKKYGIVIKGHSGQHLLIDPNMQRKVVDQLDPQPDDLLLEIGPGLGALTREILERGCKLWAVEKDERFIAILKEEFGTEIKKKRFNLVHEDILKFNLKTLPSPYPSPAGRGKEKSFPSPQRGEGRVRGKLKIISNLPYYITAPILFHLIDFRPMISKAVLTMQREVARRLLASPGTKDYGRLTLGVRYAADLEHAFDIPPPCFTPAPKVDSSVIVLQFHPLESTRGMNEQLLFHLIQVAFSQRRKMLLRLLGQDRVIGKNRKMMTALFKKLGFPEKVRGEELLLKDYLALAEALERTHALP